MMNPETVHKYEHRYAEGYDIESDEFYAVWKKLKCLSLSETDPVPTQPEPSTVSNELELHASIDGLLVYPGTPKGKKGGPKFLSGEQIISYLEEKKALKRRQKKIRRSERKIV